MYQNWSLKAGGLLIQVVSNTGLTVVALGRHAQSTQAYLGRNFFGSSFPKRQILDSSKLKEFALDNSMEMADSSPKGQKTLWETEKLLVTSNFSFSHSVLKNICTADT